jgi:hypothetical protein
MHPLLDRQVAEWPIYCGPHPSSTCCNSKENNKMMHSWRSPYLPGLDLRYSWWLVNKTIMEFLYLWDVIFDLQLQLDIEGCHIWRHSSSGQYSAKLVYEGFFMGATQFGPYERIWKIWAPPKCCFFMWLVAHARCWMMDWLAGRRLPHLARCLLCYQDQETSNHLQVSCVFARQFWFSLF